MQINASQNLNTSVNKLLEDFIPPSKEINEEELFTGLIASKLSTLKGLETGEAYNKTVKGLIEMGSSRKRRVQLEDAALHALNALVTDKTLTKAERDKIYTESFRAAQLDSDHTKIYDSKGSKDDPTIAVAKRSRAIASAVSVVQQLDSGQTPPEKSTSLASPKSPTPPSTGRPHGFLFKPLSSSSSTVAVLIPAELGKRADAVRLLNSRGEVIESGKFTSFGEDGKKAKYSFSKPGRSYPKELLVEIVLKNGDRSWIPIPDPSKRYE